MFSRIILFNLFILTVIVTINNFLFNILTHHLSIYLLLIVLSLLLLIIPLKKKVSFLKRLMMSALCFLILFIGTFVIELFITNVIKHQIIQYKYRKNYPNGYVHKEGDISKIPTARIDY